MKMTMPAPGSKYSVPASSSNSARQLTEWAVAALELLGFVVGEATDDGSRRVRPAQNARNHWGPLPEYQGSNSFAFTSLQQTGGAERLTFSSPLWRWILEQLHARELPLSAAPIGDPQAVHEFSGRLLSQYQVDGGSAHLAGCRLDPQAFVRVLQFDDQGIAAEYLTPAREVEPGMSAALIGQLHLNEWRLSDAPRNITHRQLQEIHRWATATQTGIALDGTTVSVSDLTAGDRPPLLIAEWCHRASGKFEFEIGDAALSVSFDDWARNLTPPPIICPVTGEPTYHLAITGDGRLIAAEQLAPCAVCQQRLPRPELAASSISGKLVCKAHIEQCPMTGGTLLAEEFIECPTTRLMVSPAAVRQGQTALMEELEPLDPAETILARLRLDNPALDRYSSWRLARGAEVDLYVGSKLLGKVLVAVRRDTGEVLAVAQKSAWAWNWKPLEQ